MLTQRLTRLSGHVRFQRSCMPALGLAMQKPQCRGFSLYGGNQGGRRSPPPLSFFGVAIVPEREAFIVERLGKFTKILSSGIHFIIPVVDRVSYVHSLKEETLAVPNQAAITRDNVTIHIDGVLYVRIVDPMKASYGVENPLYAVMQLAQTSMRSELGKLSLDETFAEREALNTNIVAGINKASEAWGVECLRYEIRDILPPDSVRAAMDQQASAERHKRANVLESEGERQAEINMAEGQKMAAILKAEGVASKIIAEAEATAKATRLVAKAISEDNGNDAVSLRVAEQYIDAFAKLAKESNSVIIPSNVGDAPAMITQAMSIYNTLQGSSTKPARKLPTSEEE